MTIEILILGYLGIGLVFSLFAHVGHKRRFGKPLHWGMWTAGTVGWPLIVYLGGPV